MRKKENQYRQCRLLKKYSTGTSIQTSYIPAEFAKKGQVLKLRDGEDDIWEEGWIVEDVYGMAVPQSRLPNHHKAIKAHRSNTGDSLPKSKV